MRSRTSLQVAILVLASSASFSQQVPPAPIGRTPVLVELFTSEGCSSCPPADRYIEFLDSQPMPGLDLIVLSEHVDYWDQLGWRDPFSSREISLRQDDYRIKLHLPEVYTPQVVIDGTREMPGSDKQNAEEALKQAGAQAKAKFQMKVTGTSRDRVSLQIECAPLAADSAPRSLDVYVAFALNRADTEVARGENAKRHLTHIAVLRKLIKVAKFKTGEPFSLTTDLNPGVPLKNGIRVVAFLQDPESRRVYGAVMRPVAAD
jgi:hypothetical protein